MAKYQLTLTETLEHIIEVEADNEEAVKKIFEEDKIDWASAECYDSQVQIDDIKKVV